MPCPEPSGQDALVCPLTLRARCWVGMGVQDFLVSGLVPTLTSLLEAGKPQAWEHIRRAWAEETSVCQEELGAALQGFALTPEESRSITAGVEAAARKAVEDKTRELAKRALGLMKERCAPTIPPHTAH